jgi:outer membrane receptor protein involved in Fe transport
MIKQVILALTFILASSYSFAQFPAGAGRMGQIPNAGRFYGKIIDSTTGKPINAASVQLFQNKYDSVSKTKKDVLIDGLLTKANGEFSLEELNIMGLYILKVSAIGYKTSERRLNFEIKMNGGDMSQMLNRIDKDLGNIKLSSEIVQMNEVVITGDKPILQLGVDRKIFNVDKNIVSSGGTAVDIMRNVPTLNVDVDGNVTMRNNAPEIFVDGRPTQLTLEQIPADAIQSVELITNPSAKFDASGGQSSIINIILKKNKRVGYNGSVRAGIDMRRRFNTGGDFNIRQGSINFFVNVGYNQRKSIAWGETERNNLTPSNNLSTLNLDNDNTNTGAFLFGRTGFDFFINNRNTITIAGNFAGGNFQLLDTNRIKFNYLNTNFLDSTENRYTNAENIFRNSGAQISYKRLFPKAGKEWTADINFNRSRSENDQTIQINTSRFFEGNSPINKVFLQGVDAGGGSSLFVGQTDFVNPINDDSKFEAGFRTQIRWFESFQNNSINNISLPGISNEFSYVDYVHAAYTSYSQRIKKYNLNYQIGLRIESSSYEGKQVGKAEPFTNQFPLALFPSAFISKTIKENQDIQLNYSRRVKRPNFYQLLPNTDFTDVLNYQTGNPDLIPEFTHSVEISYQKTYGQKKNIFLATLFGKQTNNLIARYQEPRKLGNTDSIGFVTTWVNATTSYATGLELVFRNTLTKWWEINYNANFYYSKINGTSVLPTLENERTSYTLKINNTFRLGKSGWTIQLSGDYNSRSILPVSSGGGGGRGGGMMGGGGGWMGGGQISTTQGYIDANYYLDLGIRKEFKIKNNTAALSINWSDFLRTRQNIVFSIGEGFDQNSWRRRDPQFVRVNFSYRFGKFDVSIFKRKNNRMEMGDDLQTQ